MQSLSSTFNENYFILITVMSFFITVLSFRISLPVFTYLRFLDKPKERSNHAKPIALGGGLVVIPIITIITFLFGYEWSAFQIFPLLILFLISLIDDIKNVKSLLRLIIHFFCISIYVHYFLIGQISFLNDISFEYLVAIIYILMILGISWFINAFNFMDGIDGITSIKVVYLTISLIFFNYYLGYEGSILNYCIIGVILGFLLFNWSPAKIFLGDSGSIPLGFIMSHLLLDLSLKGYWLSSIILVIYYLLDTSTTLIIRIWSKEKFWQAHSQHFYQKAVRNGRTHQEVCLNIIVMSLGLFLFALLAIVEKNNLIYLISSIVWCIFFLLKFSNKKNINT